MLYIGNEWKTRFETQEEMNQQLERQLIMLQDKVEEAKRNLKDGKCCLLGNKYTFSEDNSLKNVCTACLKEVYSKKNLLAFGDLLSVCTCYEEGTLFGSHKIVSWIKVAKKYMECFQSS